MEPIKSLDGKRWFIWALVVIVVGFIGLTTYIYYTSQMDANQTTTDTIVHHDTKPVDTNSIVYKNDKYGFTFTLPKTWQGYKILESTWNGTYIGDQTTKVSGPIVTIRNPNWTQANPTQDIPIMIFIPKQWTEVSDENHNPLLTVGAAPIPPSELGSNSTYFFALPARYNFAEASGIEEVQKIIDSKPLKGFDTGVQLNGKPTLPVTKDGAIKLVQNLPEVKDFFQRINQKNGPAVVVVTPAELQDPKSNNPYWSIHVYQDLYDNVATLNWYYVYQKTGQITREFPID